MMAATNDAQGTRDRQIQNIFQHEQQHAVKKRNGKNVKIFGAHVEITNVD